MALASPVLGDGGPPPIKSAKRFRQCRSAGGGCSAPIARMGGADADWLFV